MGACKADVQPSAASSCPLARCVRRGARRLTRLCHTCCVFVGGLLSCWMPLCWRLPGMSQREGANTVRTHWRGNLPPPSLCRCASVADNSGLEAITWVPDTFLTARGFHDESTGAAYNPAAYPATVAACTSSASRPGGCGRCATTPAKAAPPRWPSAHRATRWASSGSTPGGCRWGAVRGGDRRGMLGGVLGVRGERRYV
jgi:hypothetical protein